MVLNYFNSASAGIKEEGSHIKHLFFFQKLYIKLKYIYEIGAIVYFNIWRK
jgi:hypothetical protein